MEIKFKRTQNFADVINLHKQIFNEDNKSFFNSIQSKDHYKTFEATHNNKLIAYCIISDIGGEAEVINIATICEFRNQNIATKLLDYATDNINAKTVYLEVSHTNQPAINLYKKCGFKEYGIRKKYYGDTDAILMKKHKN